MGGQKFKHDESGSTLFYFVLSFLGLVLVPATFYYWPRKRKEDPVKQAELCQCSNCVKKRLIIEQSQPYRSVKNFFIKVAIVSGRTRESFKTRTYLYTLQFQTLILMKYWDCHREEHINKSYRKQSLALHPDKETGDEKAFMRLPKAYQALTDDEARRNWEKYGNPDGPGAMSFGVALAS